jgi:hypothetical protein
MVTAGPASTTGGTTPTSPPISEAQCPAPNKNVKVLSGTYRPWLSTGSMMIQLNSPQEIHAMSFTTGDVLDFRSQISFGSQSWTSNFRQHLWISECPGGPAISGCDKEGAGGVGQSLTWGMKKTYIGRQDKEVKIFCVLSPKRTYYVNYQVPTCVPASGIKYPCAGFYKNSPNLRSGFNLDGTFK